MPRERPLLILALVLIATSLASSMTALHFYGVWSERSPEPHGSLNQDGSWNPFSDGQLWNPWSDLLGELSANHTLPVPVG